MLESIEEVFTDEKTRNRVIDSIKNIPISDTTTSRRVETLASDVFQTLLDKLKKAASCCQTCQPNTLICSSTMTLDGLAKGIR